MKIIDLLNRIANGEEVPKKIKYDSDILNYDEIARDYILIDKSGEIGLICEELNLMFALNEEVEIIEEKEMCHKCGKYPAEYNQTYCEFCLGISEEDKKIEKIGENNYKWNYAYDRKTPQAVVDNLELIRQKINEITDYINGSDK